MREIDQILVKNEYVWLLYILSSFKICLTFAHIVYGNYSSWKLCQHFCFCDFLRLIKIFISLQFVTYILCITSESSCMYSIWYVFSWLYSTFRSLNLDPVDPMCIRLYVTCITFKSRTATVVTMWYPWILKLILLENLGIQKIRILTFDTDTNSKCITHILRIN